MSAKAARDQEQAEELIARLAKLHPKKIDLSLARLERLLARLGNPERKLPPVIHVAGTNGKGSTVAFLRSMMEAAGLGVHVYTSPNLVRFNERIRLAHKDGGQFVSDIELADALATCERLNAGDPITFFEITTAAAFLVYSRHSADALLLEVGLGGRLDATNVIDRAAATVITPVSIDHTEFLGPTVKDIAAEKAGILKRGVPAIVAHQEAQVLGVIERVAHKLGAPLAVSGEQWRAHEESGRLVYADDEGLLDLPLPRLMGRHQIENAGTAIAALRFSRAFPVSPAAIEAGISGADWPARMQNLSTGRLLPLLPPGSELWLDGGHNVAGGLAIAAALAELEERAPRPLVLVVGMLGTKDTDGFLACFSDLARHVFAVPVPAEIARTPEDVAAAAHEVGLAAEPAASVEEALSRVATLKLETPPRVLITGSLYLAGAVLAANGTPPR
ncbi:MAG TPA: folylpolyglutamate synthase/dihydrofolate synthase family protein [Xanthobacteraceae bacterium]|nr:folylpolyglutamate synthase/dihydrofolate synthase family protein [Xanthobacteraceae bacterium]